MEIELIVTIFIAAIGWGWAIIQFFYKRKWQKYDTITARRYEAYCRYMRKYEEISENIRKAPQAIYGISDELMDKMMRSCPSEEFDDVITDFNQRMRDFLKHSYNSLLIVRQELNELCLIGSSELLTKLDELKELTTNAYDEAQYCLSQINVKDVNSFQIMGTLSQNMCWKRFKELNDEIIALMRREIGTQ